MAFKDMKTAVEAQFQAMTEDFDDLFVTDVSKDELWDTYLNSFPEGTNPIFRERTVHDCQCCKQWIRRMGNVVGILGDEIVSLWDKATESDLGEYSVVAAALSEVVKSRPIRDVFLSQDKKIGVDHNFDNKDPDNILKFEHFFTDLPERFHVKHRIDEARGAARDDFQVFYRSLDEITLDAGESVLELIQQNSLYRGKEHEETVKLFIQQKIVFDATKDANIRAIYCWDKSRELRMRGRIRNTVIGTLLTDISEGKELDIAVSAFETKVAPQNYKRTTAIVTQSMVKKAEEKVQELGLERALHRRYAHADDITINNVIFADRATKEAAGLFDGLAQEKVDPRKFNKVEEVPIDTFVGEILPNVNTVEMMFENKHTNQLMSLIAPVNRDAPDILKWGNGFSWSYNGEVTDSIKERVKAAGGRVDGELRCSLSWYNYDDLDIHIKEPGGKHIYYGNDRSPMTKGNLDVDMNAGGRRSRDPVENITWPTRELMLEGNYELWVNNYTKRETTDEGFEIEIECRGEVFKFAYDKSVRNGQNIPVAIFEYSKESGVRIIKTDLTEANASREEWGINTQNFHSVKMILNSPNHWDDQAIGNKHWFFVLDECKQPGQARGLYNEFLRNDLNEHRKVFEMLGAKLKAEASDDQLSGLGFSSTQRNSVLCRVTGNIHRVLRVNF